jgi:hypothetical protein
MSLTQMNTSKKKEEITPKTSKKINKDLSKKRLHKKKNDSHERTIMMMF